MLAAVSRPTGEVEADRILEGLAAAIVQMSEAAADPILAVEIDPTSVEGIGRGWPTDRGWAGEIDREWEAEIVPQD